MRSCVCSDSLRTTPLSSLCSPSSLLSSTLFFLPINFIFQDVVDKLPCAPLANEDLGTLAEYDPLTQDPD